MIRHIRPSDLRSAAQLAVQASLGITSVVEGVHQSVLRTLGSPAGARPDQTRGITGMVYKSVKGATRLVGRALDVLLAQWTEEAGSSLQTPQREAALAVLNGVLGDHLAAIGSPLVIPMQLRHRGQTLHWSDQQPAVSPDDARPDVLLVIHGLCMNDLQWRTSGGARVVDHGQTLSDAMNATPIHARYNSGLHISENGRLLANELEQLQSHWPLPLRSLSVLSHSMGGLLIRSAVDHAMRAGQTWPARLKSMAFLGTPHHGAPLERAGNWVDIALASTPYTAPFARLGHLRSAGITDLRHGNVRDADWQGQGRFERQPDRRQALPLPTGVACFTLAATTAGKRGLLADRLLGDGLVPLRSALGQHDDPARQLEFAPAHQHIAYHTNHMQLLRSPAVTAQLLRWMA